MASRSTYGHRCARILLHHPPWSLWSDDSGRMQQCLIGLLKTGMSMLSVQTGANIFHDVCEHYGINHYLGHHQADDCHLFSKGIDRIYDVFAYEEQFRSIDSKFADFAGSIAPFSCSSSEFIRRFGRWMISQHPEQRSLLSECVKMNVPVFIPALCDSSIGIGLMVARRNGVEAYIDQIADVDEIASIVEGSKKTGVIYIGGGILKNFIQQTQVIADIYYAGQEGHAYAIQYTTDAPHWGGLSGCTFEEAISWGKRRPMPRRSSVFVMQLLPSRSLHRVSSHERSGERRINLFLRSMEQPCFENTCSISSFMGTKVL